jgi:hypothetical protein
MTKPKEYSHEWTYCKLNVSPINNDEETLKEMESFEADCEDPDDDSELSFFGICPIPQILIDTVEKIDPEVCAKNKAQTGYNTLWDFTEAVWGTPYDACNVEMSYVTNDEGMVDECEALEYEFRTLNGAPLNWVKEASEVYRGLLFEIECINEMDLFDSYTATVFNGEVADISYHKNQPKN